MSPGRFLHVILIAATAGGCDDGSNTPQHGGETRVAPPPVVESVRIATFNINWGNPALHLIVDAVREADADVVLLQETTPRAERFLEATLGAEYPHRAVHGHQGRYAAERFAILSRFPLRAARFVPPEHGLFGFQVARVVLGDREVQLANVHLHPFVFSRQGGVMAFVATAGMFEDVHSREIEALLETLEAGIPTIIAGDFNSLSRFNAPTRLIEAGFVDSFAAVHADADDHPTWRWPVGSGEARLRIDYLFHDASFETKSSRVLCNAGSDHCLVVSELRFPAAQP